MQMYDFSNLRIHSSLLCPARDSLVAGARRCHVMSDNVCKCVCVCVCVASIFKLRSQKQCHHPGRVDKFHDEDRIHDGETQRARQRSIRSASEAKKEKPKDSSKNTTDVKSGGTS